MTIPLPCTFLVLSGKSGSGKSLLLNHLEASGYPSINLERIASHRGSAFGGLSLPGQPSQNDFETELQNAFNRCCHSNYIFIEQKPVSLGKRRIPGWLYSKMKAGILIQLDTTKKIRINNILRDYQPAGKINLIKALQKLSERLPANQLAALEDYLIADNYEMFIDKMLDYYDSTDNYKLPVKATFTLEITSENIREIAANLLELLPRHEINLHATEINIQ